MVTLAVVSVFGKLLARHVIVECWCMRDKFLMTNLLVWLPTNEKSNSVLSTGFPFHSLKSVFSGIKNIKKHSMKIMKKQAYHWILGTGEPPRTSHSSTMSLPSSYGPANDWIISPRSFKIFGFCGGTKYVKRHAYWEEKDRQNMNVSIYNNSKHFLDVNFSLILISPFNLNVKVVKWWNTEYETNSLSYHENGVIVLCVRLPKIMIYLPTTSRCTTLFLVGDNLKSTLHRKSPESSAYIGEHSFPEEWWITAKHWKRDRQTDSASGKMKYVNRKNRPKKKTQQNVWLLNWAHVLHT